MKFILFCNLPYSFSILKPLEEEIIKQNHEYLWYLPENILEQFPYKESNYTTNIKDLKSFQSDIIYVPGNDVPHFLRGLKVQIFHGLAGEKKGHFRIRDYFDLYLTQGPYFTKRFKELSIKYKNFDVIETGWCKLDKLYTTLISTKQKKEELLKKHNVKSIILYAPTFSPSLTSGEALIETITKLSKKDDILVVIKFHDKMNEELRKPYQNIKNKNLIVSKEKDITKLLQISDLMISDTSSVVYEFILLNKPVVTLNSISENINWENLSDKNKVFDKTIEILNGKDNFIQNRSNTISNYHPYNDGKSAERVIDASVNYIKEHGVPNNRKLSLLRKVKINNKYGWFV